MQPSPVPINLNPYQGLKRVVYRAGCKNFVVPINLNPYQGLKHGVTRDDFPSCVPINLNPYQGLKLRLAEAE